MSNPVDRPSGKDDISSYAPKWARDPNEASRRRQQQPGQNLKLLGSEDRVTTVPAESFNPLAELPRRTHTLEPVVMADPPIPESWLRSDRSSSIKRDRIIGGFFPFVFAASLAALVAFLVAVEWPRFTGVIAKEVSFATTFSERFGLKTAADPAPTFKAADQTAESRANPRTESETASATTVASAQGQPQPSMNALLPWPTEQANPAAERPQQADAHIPATTTEPKAVATIAVAPGAKNSTIGNAPPPGRPLSQDEVETLLKQGHDFVSVGDFASARMLFQRIAEARDFRGALAYAATYDPIALASIGAKGASPDLAKARSWYAMAQELGAPDASARLEALASGTK